MSRKRQLLIVCLVAMVLGWSYFPTFLDIVDRWWTNPLYSHGYLVPAFAAYLLWRRWDSARSDSWSPSWWGIAWIGVGISAHLFGAYYYFDWISAAAILPVFVGIVVAVGGNTMLRWSWSAIAFLVFMLPLPYSVETSLAYPLQRLATVASTYVLQTCGFAAISEGNVIIMEHERIGVVEACNGLGMLVTFFAMATAVVMMMNGRWLNKTIMVVSAVPIALIANTIRISVTGVLAETVGGEAVDSFIHGPAGWLMPFVALGLLFFEKLILDRLFIEVPEQEETFRFEQAPVVRQTCAV